MSELADNVGNIARLDRLCIEMTYDRPKPADKEELREYVNGLFAICAGAYEIWNEIRFEISDASSLKMPDKATRDTLKRIRNGEELYVIRQYKSLCSILNRNITDQNSRFSVTLDEFLLERLDDLDDDFNSWFSIVDYYRRQILAGCVIVPIKSKPDIDKYYFEIREAFAYGLFKSSKSLCRALLEFVLFDQLSSRGKLPRTSVHSIETGEKEGPSLFRMTKMAEREGLLLGDALKKAHKIRIRGNDILHPKGKLKNAMTEEAAYDVIRDAVFVVEHLLER